MLLDVTVNEVLPAVAGTFWFDGATSSVGVAPAWVTVTTTGEIPVTVTVTFATRAVVFGFVVKFAVIVPFPVPEGVTVHHVWLLVTVQLLFDVTLNVVDPADAGTFWFEGETRSVGVPTCPVICTSSTAQ